MNLSGQESVKTNHTNEFTRTLEGVKDRSYKCNHQDKKGLKIDHTNAFIRTRKG